MTDIPEMCPPLRLAAVLHLLSSTALGGASPNKIRALLEHLEGLAGTEGLNPYLYQALETVRQDWLALDGRALVSSLPAQRFH